MTKNNKLAIIAVLIIIILIVIGVTKKPPQSADAPEEKTKIGVIIPATGVAAGFAEEMRKGIESIEPVDGVEFVFEDDKCDPKEAVTVFRKLVDFDKVQFIIGPACGSPQESIAPLLKESKTLAIIPAAASRTLFGSSDKKFFNIQYALEDESKFIAEQLSARGYENVALVSYKNAFSETHTKSFRDNFTGTIAVDVVLENEKVNPASELAKIKAAQVDAIYSPDISFFFAGGLTKLREIGITAPIFATYVAEIPAARSLVPDVYYSFPGDLSGTEGAIFNLTREAAELMGEAIVDCKGAYDCVYNKISSSSRFDDTGTSKRSIVLKQIKDEVPVLVQ